MSFKIVFFRPQNLATGSTAVQRYGCIPRSAASNSGEIPPKLGALNSLF